MIYVLLAQFLVLGLIAVVTFGNDKYRKPGGIVLLLIWGGIIVATMSMWGLTYP